MSNRRLVIAGLATMLLSSTIAPAACSLPQPIVATRPDRDVTADDLARLRDIGSPDSSLVELPSPMALTANGNALAFILTQGDPATNTVCRWVISTGLRPGAPLQVLDQGGEPLTYEANVRGLRAAVGLARSITPAWSPDSTKLGYLRRDDGVTQVWLTSAAKDPRPLTHSPVDIEYWAWLSDHSIAIASRTAAIDERTQIEREGRQGWLYDARFSPQVSGRPQPAGALPIDIQVIDVATGVQRPADDAERAALELRRGDPDTDPPLIGRYGSFTLKADGPAPFDPQRLHFNGLEKREVACSADACARGIVRLYLDADGRGVTYLRREGWAKETTAFYHWQPGRGAPRRLSSTLDVLIGCLRSGAKFVCLRETSTQPRHIALIDPATGDARRVFDPNPEFAGLRRGLVTRLRWRNNRGLASWGDLVLPPGPPRKQPLPLIVVQYHSDGFLRGGTGDEFPIFPLAARGFAVLSVEVPGSVAQVMPNITSWDDVYRADQRDWADRRSLLSALEIGVSQAMTHASIDRQRVGVTGVSDGATSARFALINSRLFAAAAISGAAIEPNTAMTYGGIAWADFNRRSGYPGVTAPAGTYWQPASLAHNARAIDTPLLIQAPDDEYLLSLEAFTALREQGKPVELYVFPGEHHITWQPAHRLAIYQRVIDWFAYWLQGASDPDQAKTSQYARWRAIGAGIPGHSSTLP